METAENTPASAATPAPAPWAQKPASEAPTPVVASGSTPDATSEALALAKIAPPVQPAIEIASELVDTVTVTVPKAYKLRLTAHHELEIKAGIQEMERSQAEHWYSIANGVTIYKP